MAFKMTPEYKQQQLINAERARCGTEAALYNHISEGADERVIEAHRAQLRHQDELVTRLRLELAVM